MSDWPDGWTDDNPRGNRPQAPGGARPQGPPEQARVMRHVQRVPPPTQRPPSPPGQRTPTHDSYADPYADPYGEDQAGYDSGYSEGQVYRGARQPRGPQPPTPPSPSPYDEPRERRWPRRVAFSALALVLILVIVATGTFFWADSKLRREVDLSMVEDRPEKGKGTNYLIVGSDSREGLSEEEQKELHTGSVEGQRTDTMILLHVGDNGNTMVSLPRDSLVTIPEFTGSSSGNRIPASENVKLNEAYADEGPWLLVRTVEYNLDLRIDHYMEIGFGGFANVVDALGGVEMCFDEPIRDKNSGADFDEGCHNLNGAEALAYNRQRYQEATGDLGRTRNQQEFLGTISDKAASPSTLLNPFRLYPTLGAGLDSLIVDKDMSLWDLRSVFFAMRNAKRMNMPCRDLAVHWDENRVEELTEQLRNDEKVTVSDEIGDL